MAAKGKKKLVFLIDSLNPCEGTAFSTAMSDWVLFRISDGANGSRQRSSHDQKKFEPAQSAGHAETQ